MSEPTMTVLGLDVSLTRTGWAVLDYDTGTLLDTGFIVTNSSDSLVERLDDIYQNVATLIATLEAPDVAIEEGVSHGSGSVTRKLAAAWGAAALAVRHRLHLDPTEINNSTVKRTAGAVRIDSYTPPGPIDVKKLTTRVAAHVTWPTYDIAADVGGDIADALWVAEIHRRNLHAKYDMETTA